MYSRYHNIIAGSFSGVNIFVIFVAATKNDPLYGSQVHVLMYLLDVSTESSIDSLLVRTVARLMGERVKDKFRFLLNLRLWPSPSMIFSTGLW